MKNTELDLSQFIVIPPPEPDQTIKIARESKRLKQLEVANILGLSLRQYQRYENGEKELGEAPFQVGMAICELLELDPFDFITHLKDILENDWVRPGIYEEEDKR